MGSGPGGRIISTDVPLAAPLRTAPAAAPVASPAPATPSADGIVRRKLNTMRKAIAKNLQYSKQTVPHFYIRATINADPLTSFYHGEKAKYPCSINDVVVLACAKAIREFPAFRSRIEGDEIVELPSVNIGIAVGVPDGLVVPVIQNVDQLTLQHLGAESKRIVVAARNGKIEGMGKGIFTISNMGMFGVEEFTAIVNPPESAILAVGATREQVIVSGGTMRPGRVMTMTLSVDHRIIDGMLAAKFMARLKELLEWPAQMI
jgi:pyruvate dehydrogenase E2 component (dihydrolipoamide acetyltransferase)